MTASHPHILVHDYPGHAFPIDLSRALAKRGYPVTHAYTSAVESPRGTLSSDIPGLNVVNLGVDTPPVQKGNLIRRRFQEAAYGDVLRKLCDDIQPNLILSSNTPLEAQKKLLSWANRHDVPFVFWLQDIISIATKSILSDKLGPVGSIIGWHYGRVEAAMLRRSQHVVVIAEDFQDIIADWGVRDENITVIPNWAPIDQIPVLPHQNPFSEKLKLHDKFVVLYAGTLGLKHNPMLIAEAAQRLMEHKDIVFLVVSEGLSVDVLRRVKTERQLDNLQLLPFQSFEDFPYVLATGDVMLTLLEPDAGIFSVPSKVWSAFAAQRPSILVVPTVNLAAKITERHQTGIVLGNADADALADAILALHNNPERRKTLAQNARAYANAHFHVDKIADRFERVIQQLVG